ncbi:MAG: zeta toxin family protein [Fluviicola sp.]|nr:zeta toxin family protein [Fluviicola sp.]
MEKQKQLFIIAGPIGAGKTTASLTILPEVLQINEFVNADIIAYGLSPLNPDSVAIQAGRMMLSRIDELLKEQVSFAIETTLATKSYASLIQKAKSIGYEVHLLYFWLKSPNYAINRVAKRVAEGGHDIPKDVIKRRYYSGIKNLFHIYTDICHVVNVYDNTEGVPNLIFKVENATFEIVNDELYALLKTI